MKFSNEIASSKAKHVKRKLKFSSGIGIFKRDFNIQTWIAKSSEWSEHFTRSIRIDCFNQKTLTAKRTLIIFHLFGRITVLSFQSVFSLRSTIGQPFAELLL